MIPHPIEEEADSGSVATDGPAGSSSRNLYRAPQGFLKRLERILETGLRLEHGANIFPLLHVFFYYAFFVTLAGGWLPSPWLVVPSWVVLVLLNYSLTIGILHLHAHRKLFNRRLPNRILELLLCMPSGLSYPVMLFVHVHLHHRYEDGEGDPTSTKGCEKGRRAVWYWLIYPFVCHKTAIVGLFSRNASPVWKRLRVQYVLDTATVPAILVTYGMLDFSGMLLFYALPLVIVSVNIGFFAWLTHAPAHEDPAKVIDKHDINGSINTTNNWMNLFIHNQGYHAVHHRYPGIHWTQIPDRLAMMKNVDDALIVPYWVTLENAVRILRPRSFRNAAYGKHWKQSYRQRIACGRHRLRFLPYFGWIR